MARQSSKVKAPLPRLESFERRTEAFSPHDVPVLLDIGHDILALGPCGTKQTGQGKQVVPMAQVKELFWRWLEVFRCEEALNILNASGRGDKWFDLIVRGIRELNITTGDLFRHRVAKYRQRALFLTFHEGEIRQHSWEEVAARADAIAAALLALQRDPSPVVLFAGNSLDTAVCDLACLTRGIVNAVIPARTTVDHVEQILKRTSATVAIVRDAETYSQLTGALDAGAAVRHVVVMDTSRCPLDSRIIPLSQLQHEGRRLLMGQVQWPEVKAEDRATIMFTSGTTGLPKGVAFTHLNLVSKRFARALALPFVGENNVFVAYLPLYHTFGRWLEMLGTIFWGGRYAFASNPSIKTLLDNMRRARATGMISVPQKWLQLRDQITRRIDVETSSDAQIREVFDELTGGHLRWGLSAAGHLDEAVFLFFQRIGVDLMSGFGMTEATGGITMTPPGRYVAGTVGKPLPGIELELGEDNELLIRGPYVAVPLDAEGEVAERSDDWFPTGDIAMMDANGYVTLVDRKKDIYKNLKGETIAPQRIENFFADYPGVGQAFLVGDHRSYNTLLIAPDFRHSGTNLTRLGPAELKEFFRPYVVTVNRFLAPHERVVDFAVLDRSLSVEAGELTAKGTYRRRIVESRYRDYIEPMYRRQYVELSVGTLTVRVPHWFLRVKGLTESDITVEGEELVLAATGERLQIARDPDDADGLLLGSLVYAYDQTLVNLDVWLRAAHLWVGNADLVAFAGAEIAQWRATGPLTETKIRPEKRRNPASRTVPTQTTHEPGPIGALMDMHAAAVTLITSASSCEATRAAMSAVEYLGKVLIEGTFEFASLARERLAWAAYHDEFKVRSFAYRALLLGEAESGHRSSLGAFIASGRPFLDAESIEAICEARLDDEQLSALRARLEEYRSELTWPVSETTHEQFLRIIDLLASYGMSHPESYAAIRSELASWMLFGGDPELSTTAGIALEALTTSFRSQLQQEIETKTTLPEGVIEFELGIDAEHQKALSHAFAATTLLPETVYVLFGGKRLHCEDLALGGIWVSQLGGRFGSLLFHVIVETRTCERFEFDIALNQSQSPEYFNSTEILRMRCGDLPGRHPSVARLGGLWPELGIATREDIGGETLEAFWVRASRLPGQEIYADTQWECRHHLRLALAACVDFWKQTGSTWMLAAPSPRDVIIPARQLTRRVRLFNITGRVRYTSFSELVMAMYRGFYHPLSHECPALRALLDPAMIYEAFLEVVGEPAGRAAFAEVLPVALAESAAGTEMRIFWDRIREADVEVEERGFRPFPLRAAVQNYRRWLALNPAATREAKMRTVIGSYYWHNLRDLEHQYPDVRVRLFRETIWSEANAVLRSALDRAIQELRGQSDPQQQILRRVSEIRMDARITEEDDYYLTWLTYPYLKPGQKARLVLAQPTAKAYEPLSTTIQDAKGEAYEMRGATSPREVARLAWLLRQSGISIFTHPEHEVMVLVNSRGVLVGGLVYWMQDEEHAWIQSIVVSLNLRGRGLGRAMVEDLLSRLRGQGVRVVTVDFLQPRFWTDLGFEANAEYGGLTKMLTD